MVGERHLPCSFQLLSHSGKRLGLLASLYIPVPKRMRRYTFSSADSQVLFMIHKIMCTTTAKHRKMEDIWAAAIRTQYPRFCPSISIPWGKKDADLTHGRIADHTSPFAISREKHLQFFYTCRADFLICQGSRNHSLLARLHSFHSFFDSALSWLSYHNKQRQNDNRRP